MICLGNIFIVTALLVRVITWVDHLFKGEKIILKNTNFCFIF
jgi:hypothetical protein